MPMRNQRIGPDNSDASWIRFIDTNIPWTRRSGAPFWSPVPGRQCRWKTVAPKRHVGLRILAVLSRVS
ncbi:MAG: hypothetical protein KAY46_26800, partial [Burkholderiaceae bacterium]|nr:hypothetical protein [Burkholderiaceae bacterium]